MTPWFLIICYLLEILSIFAVIVDPKAQTTVTRFFLPSVIKAVERGREKLYISELCQILAPNLNSRLTQVPTFNSNIIYFGLFPKFLQLLAWRLTFFTGIIEDLN